MKVKTSELTGRALTFAVIMAKGHRPYLDDDLVPYYRHEQHGSLVYPNYLNWSDAGRIIDCEGVFRIISPKVKGAADTVARLPNGINGWYEGYGPTSLIAVMRCFIVSRLGDEVDIHEKLA